MGSERAHIYDKNVNYGVGVVPAGFVGQQLAAGWVDLEQVALF
jgi:hypothetical protein